jgi:hypothetical protein
MAWSRFSNSNTSVLCLMNIKSKNSHKKHANDSALLFLKRIKNKLFFAIHVILTVKLKSPKVNKLPKANKANKQTNKANEYF